MTSEGGARCAPAPTPAIAAGSATRVPNPAFPAKTPAGRRLRTPVLTPGGQPVPSRLHAALSTEHPLPNSWTGAAPGSTPPTTAQPPAPGTRLTLRATQGHGHD
jgi:hypothetical protein